MKSRARVPSQILTLVLCLFYWMSDLENLPLCLVASFLVPFLTGILT